MASYKFILIITIFIPIFGYLLNDHIQFLQYIPQQNLSIKQNQVTASGLLLNEDGSLAEAGWAKKAIKVYDESLIAPQLFGLKQLNQFRIKKWDFYSVFSDDLIIALAVANLGYIGTSFIHIYDLKNDQKYYIQPYIIPWSMPDLQYGSLIHKGNIEYQSENYNISFKNIHSSGFQQRKIIKYSSTLQNHNIKLDLELIRHEDQDAIITLLPISEDGKQFYYTNKGYNLFASGKLIVDNIEYNIDKQNFLGGHDIGRGVWAFKTFWVWATASGFDKSRNRIGLNLGGGFQHQNVSKSTEDSFFINDRIIKLNAAKYQIYQDSLTNQYHKQWSFATSTFNQPGDAKIFFEPTHQQQNGLDTFFMMNKLIQYYGYYKGQIILEDGTIFQFQNLRGFAEIHRAKW